MPSDLRRFSKGQAQRPGRLAGVLDPQRAAIWSREKGCWVYLEFSEAEVEREAYKHDEDSWEGSVGK